ncbi:MAG: hypothetical protein VX239_03985 [Candidatus Thermoplasmatota archaeon]|nr:hypothetical protein [Candidatus Thermoplasmatota archaeon]MEE3208075.1 hypothetical protein [Candidatus Thermoplasmatota archaeon]
MKPDEKKRLDSIVEMLQATYYPGHHTTAQRVIERHLIREFGYRPREATYFGSKVIETLCELEMISQAPEDTTRNTLWRVDLRKLATYTS